MRYGDSFGFLGLYIVKPEYRGRGLGMTVWNAGMAYLAGRTVGLDGVVAQQDNYRKSGFEFAHRNVRFQGPAPGVEQHGAGLLSLPDIPFDRLLAYDLPLFGAPRAAFLSAWIGMPGVIGLAADGMKGYAVARPCVEGWKIGPLFADDEKIAEALFLGICARLPSDGPVILDVPEPNRCRHAAGGTVRIDPGVRNRPHVRRPGARPGPEPHLRHHVIRTGMSVPQAASDPCRARRRCMNSTPPKAARITTKEIAVVRVPSA